jgi:hypothetical protein
MPFHPGQSVIDGDPGSVKTTLNQHPNPVSDVGNDFADGERGEGKVVSGPIHGCRQVGTGVCESSVQITDQKAIHRWFFDL